MVQHDLAVPFRFFTTTEAEQSLRELRNITAIFIIQSMLVHSPIAVVSPSFLILCIVVMLGACVLIQMLGVSVTLLDSSALPDIFGSSVLEGLSLPITITLLYTGRDRPLLESMRASPHTPILAYALFHPPVQNIRSR